MAAVTQSENISSRRALVVDDSQIARHVLRDRLCRLGFEVETVDSAESALGRLSQGLPDIVFMDHLLPGMQGLEAVRKLRARIDNSSLRIVMYTSQDGETFGNVARVAGADDIFVKTAEGGALEKILRRLNLLPGSESVPPGQSKVVSLSPHRRPADSSLPLDAVLEPILDRHRENMRQDLLAEFAILERYEERMRHDTMQRIESMSRHAISSIMHSLDERQRIDEKRVAARNKQYFAPERSLSHSASDLPWGRLPADRPGGQRRPAQPSTLKRC